MSERFPDIEIYIHKTDADAVQAWLESELKHPIQRLTQSHWLGRYQNQRLDIAFNPEVKKDFASLWFKQNATPWNNDLECAVAANAALDTEIRCSADGWEEEQDDSYEEVWLKVLRGKAKKFIWH